MAAVGAAAILCHSCRRWTTTRPPTPSSWCAGGGWLVQQRDLTPQGLGKMLLNSERPALVDCEKAKTCKKSTPPAKWCCLRGVGHKTRAFATSTSSAWAAAGMSGIAEVLFNLGYRISGSDLADSATLRRLAGLGIKTCLGHARSAHRWADAVVTSTAVTADNPKCWLRAKRNSRGAPRPHAGRADAPEAGHCHCTGHPRQDHHHQPGDQRAGRGGLDPTFVIGGKLNSAGANARLGRATTSW